MAVGDMDERFLLEYKKCQSIRRMARASAHGYNNIFAALSGQIGMAMKASGVARNSERKEIIDELLQRGIIQTDLLYGFSLERTSEKRVLAPRAVGDRAVALLNAVSNQHRFSMEKQTETGKIYGNSHDLVLTLFYLGENAIDAMPDGGAVQLLLSADRSSTGEDCVCFRMVDGGGGFATAMREEAFTPFATSKDDFPFSGLGLFAAGRMIAGHGGEIAIDDAAEGGTCITVSIPVALAGEPQREGNVSPSADKESFHPSGGSKTFLVVDDENSMRSMLKDRLGRQGHRVYTASSCGEAVALFEEVRDEIDYILLDLWLEDSRGVSCAETLQGISRRSRFIFMSGIDNEEERGAFASWPFLKKPFSIQEIEKIIAHDYANGT